MAGGSAAPWAPRLREARDPQRLLLGRLRGRISQADPLPLVVDGNCARAVALVGKPCRRPGGRPSDLRGAWPGPGAQREPPCDLTSRDLRVGSGCATRPVRGTFPVSRLGTTVAGVTNARAWRE